MHPALRKNISLYGWFKVFNKRVFIPVTAIYLVDIGHLTLAELGIIATVTGFVTLAAQIPTGYIADRYTRRSAMMTGATLLALGVTMLVFFPSFVGGLLAGMLSGLGFSFISGSGQALIHDSLERWGDSKQYIKVMGRAQSKGLVGNIILVGLVPMTYGINHRMPFMLGIVAFLVLFGISWALVEPPTPKKDQKVQPLQGLTTGLRSFITKQTVWLFITIGLVYGLYAAPTDFSNLILKDLGMDPSYIGWIFSGSSILGAIGGYVIHHLERFSFQTFMLIDIAICCAFFVAIGATKNLTIAIVAALINIGFWRLRSIVYQHHLLGLFNGTSNKAVLMSLLGFGEQLFVIVLPLVFVLAITHLGYYHAYIVMGLTTGTLLCALIPWSFIRLRQRV